MKQIFGFLLLSLFAFLPKNAQAQATAKAKWQEMLNFHEVMSASFHGAEDGNFAPLKEKSGDLVAQATAWRKSAVPAGYKAEQTKDTLKRLVKQCKVVNKAVKAKKADAVLLAEITKAHDIFHEIVEKCRE